MLTFLQHTFAESKITSPDFQLNIKQVCPVYPQSVLEIRSVQLGLLKRKEILKFNHDLIISVCPGDRNTTSLFCNNG